MGRYYLGDITGKFWFAIQDSYDPSCFGVEHEDRHEFYVCSCYVSLEDIDATKQDIYCEGCFSSYEEHIEAMKADDIEETTTWHKSESEVNYSFGESDLDKVKETIAGLEQRVGKYMESYTIQDDDDDIQYTYELPKDVPKEEVSPIATLCLGKQIAYCLEKNGSCSFTAEL